MIGADARDFSPYHSYANGDGGVRVVKLKKVNGNYLEEYPAESFISAKADESLEDIAKRVKLKRGETLSFVIQDTPNPKGKSRIIRLEDTGIKGSFVRPGSE